MSANKNNRTVVVVDDDDINLMILVKGVQDAGYGVKSFNGAEEAWQYMFLNPQGVDIALLDKMMPGMSGVEMLRRMKATDFLKHIPVVIQTGDVGVEQMREGLEAGAYYYLTKPFHPEILLSILHSAESECQLRDELVGEVETSLAGMRLLKEGMFEFSSADEARYLAAVLSRMGNYPEIIALGLMELFYNAIEHGNLDIGFATKREWRVNGIWDQKFAEQLQKPEYAGRKVKVNFWRDADQLRLAIKDEGQGFNWQSHINDEKALLRLNEPNGRGIAKATGALEKVQYIGNGNEVRCVIRLADANDVGAGASTVMAEPRRQATR